MILCFKESSHLSKSKKPHELIALSCLKKLGYMCKLNIKGTNLLLCGFYCDGLFLPGFTLAGTLCLELQASLYKD